MRRRFFAVIVFALLAPGAVLLTLPAGAQRGGPVPPAQLAAIRMPPGFAIGMYSDQVPAARSMALGDKGTVFVGTFGLLTGKGNVGAVYAVRDANGDGRADEVITIAKGLNQPNGVAFRNGALYVAEMQRIIRYDGIESRLQNPPEPVVLKDGFLNNGNHQWREIAFGPDGKLYVALGAPCNICEPEAPYGSIARMNPDGSEFEIYARGVRNSVGLAFHPGNGQLWFTDNGGDGMGDNIPSDKLNHAGKAGMHFGYPYCHQGEIADAKFGSADGCGKYSPPAVKLGPHVAALGLTFYTGDMFPAEYKNELLIAQHGSWNRSNPLGYRIGLVHVHQGQFASGQRIFAEGWLQGRQPWGRPVDLLQLADGSVLVSDDLQGAIYRITYRQ
jgi:glucose/arabinose dehydrogenase